MEIKKAIKDLLDASQKAYQEGDMDKVQELAESIVLINEHTELFGNLLEYAEEFGKMDMLKKLRQYHEVLNEMTNQFGFIHGAPLLEDVTECIQFFDEL